jgi:hypothetical protein
MHGQPNIKNRITCLMLKCSFGLDAYLTVNTMSLNQYTSSAASSVSMRTSQRTQCLSTYTFDQLFLRSQRVPHSEQCLSTYTFDQLFLRSQCVPHSEHSLSQPILMLSCFFHLNAHLTARIVFLQPVLTLNCFFGLNAYLTAHTVSLNLQCNHGNPNGVTPKHGHRGDSPTHSGTHPIAHTREL